MPNQTGHVRYRTDRYYPCVLSGEFDDGLVHWAWVKNTTRGPWFMPLCNDVVAGGRGSETRAFAHPNCIACIAKLDGDRDPIL
jgi:hypothetical protein